MIPTKIKKVNLEIRDIEALEYKYLEEMPQEIVDRKKECSEEDMYSEENKLLQLFTNNGFTKYRFIGKVGGSNLFVNDSNDIYSADKDTDFLHFDRGHGDDNWCFILTDEVVKDMIGKRFDAGYIGYSDILEIFEKYEDKEMCIGDFIQRYLAYGFKVEKAKIRRQKERDIKAEIELKGNKVEVAEFKKGEWKSNSSNNVSASANVIYHYGGDYTFSKDIHNFFTIEELNSAENGNSRYGVEKLNWIEMLCVSKKVSYAFVSKNKNRTYRVRFKKDKMYVDGVVIPVSRSAFFISRANGDTDNLKKFKELSAVKVDFLALTSVSISTNSYNYSNIPFEVKYADKLFEITLLDKTIKKDWKGLGLFRYNLQSLKTSFGVSDIVNLRELFDISKEDMFNFMKKTQLLDKLGEED